MPKPARVHSTTDTFLSDHTNGGIPRGSPALRRPMSMVSGSGTQDAPPKPPRTGSTSPSAFVSLEREVSLQDDEWDDEEDAYYNQDEEGFVEAAEGYEEAEVNGRHDEDDGYHREDSAGKSGGCIFMAMLRTSWVWRVTSW